MSRSMDDYSETDTINNQEGGDKGELDLTGCCIYLVFLSTFFAMVLVGGEASSDAFWSGTAIKQECVDFNRLVDNETQIMDWGDLSEASRFWTFLIETVMDEMIVEEYYNGEDITAEKDIDKFNNHLILMGGFRLRQYRVKSEECMYRDQMFTCYTNEEETKTMKSVHDGAYEDIEWTSRSENDETPYYRGEHGYYPGSGFVVLLPRHRVNATKIVGGLKKGLWIDAHTRMISLDFNQYNPSTGLHTVSRIVFEFTHSGAVIPSKSIRTFRFLRYTHNFQAVIVDSFFGLFVLFSIISELREFCSFRRRGDCWGYLSFWNCMDVACVILNLSIGIMNIIIYYEGKQKQLTNREEFVSMVFS